MESLYLLIPLSVAVVFVIGWLFWRALESGQFDDLERPAHDILMDDDRPKQNRGQTPISPKTAESESDPTRL
jgi:cbb3-type cytochrome oxidase maturation protein